MEDGLHTFIGQCHCPGILSAKATLVSRGRSSFVRRYRRILTNYWLIPQSIGGTTSVSRARKPLQNTLKTPRSEFQAMKLPSYSGQVEQNRHRSREYWGLHRALQIHCLILLLVTHITQAKVHIHRRHQRVNVLSVSPTLTTRLDLNKPHRRNDPPLKVIYS